MYILEMYNDFGYGGYDLYKIVVSQDKSKLITLSEEIKIELLEKKEKYEEIVKNINTKWGASRIGSRRSQGESDDFKHLTEELFKTFELLTKYSLTYANYYENNTEFTITEIGVV